MKTFSLINFLSSQNSGRNISKDESLAAFETFGDDLSHAVDTAADLRAAFRILAKAKIDLFTLRAENSDLADKGEKNCLSIRVHMTLSQLFMLSVTEHHIATTLDMIASEIELLRLRIRFPERFVTARKTY